jgi:Uma2 family endonuclease
MQVSKGFNLPKFATIDAAKFFDPIRTPRTMVATPINTALPASPSIPTIEWVQPPHDFVLDDTPVENNGQPLIAGALKESLELTGRLPASGMIAINFGLCARIAGELTLKAPDWLYISKVNQPGIPRKSYTPHLEGAVPEIVMEFLSDADGTEYSHRKVNPVGKWHFYEKILKVPNYIIFQPDLGLLEVYRLKGGVYTLEQPDVEGRHWFAELGLFLGAWKGIKEDHSTYWLRWWDAEGNILPWAVEQIAQERAQAEAAQQQAEAAQQQADREKQRADRLAAILRAQGIDPDAIE